MPRLASLLAALTADEFNAFFPGTLAAELRSLATDFVALDPLTHTPETYAAALAATRPEILLAAWKTPALPAALPPGLRYLCNVTGSVKRVVTRAQIEGGLLVTNWGSSVSRTVAEGALFHVLACLRNGSHWAVAMHRPGVAAWKSGLHDSRSLFGRSVGIHGFGPVAREFVALLRPWGCAVSAFAPDLTPELARAHGVQRADSLEALFANHDVIVELAPLIPATTGIVTEKILRLIRPGGVFVNVGRGAVVDEAALARIAAEGKISVGLDVFTREPLPADSPFRALPQVSLTPHTAGPTIDRFPDAGAFALQNLRAYAEGRPLAAIITPEIYDRSS